MFKMSDLFDFNEAFCSKTPRNRALMNITNEIPVIKCNDQVTIFILDTGDHSFLLEIFIFQLPWQKSYFAYVYSKYLATPLSQPFRGLLCSPYFVLSVA